MRRASLVFPLLAATLVAQSAEERAALRAWLAKGAKPPSATELPALLDRVLPLLASPDPEVRDDLAFSLVAKWMYRDRIVPVERRRALLAAWIAQLPPKTDAKPDEVVGRSFAALCLSLLVALDNQEPWLTDAEFAQLVTAALDYLRAEHDVRGFDAKLGWVHSVAHTADLLKFVARSKRLQASQQEALLTAIADKLAQTEAPLVHGEDERLARAVLSLAAREDCAVEAFAAWVRTVFAPPASDAPTAADLAREHNRRHLLLSLHALLAVDGRTEVLQHARDAVQAALQRRLR